MAQEIVPYLVYLPNGQRVVERTTRTGKDWAVAEIEAHCGSWRINRIVDSADPARIGSVLVATAERVTEEDVLAMTGKEPVKHSRFI